MKFTNYLKDIDHVSIFPMVTLILFVSIFIAAVFYCLFMDRDTAVKSGQMPLDESEISGFVSKTKDYE